MTHDACAFSAACCSIPKKVCVHSGAAEGQKQANSSLQPFLLVCTLHLLRMSNHIQAATVKPETLPGANAMFLSKNQVTLTHLDTRRSQLPALTCPCWYFYQLCFLRTLRRFCDSDSGCCCCCQEASPSCEVQGCRQMPGEALNSVLSLKLHQKPPAFCFQLVFSPFHPTCFIYIPRSVFFLSLLALSDPSLSHEMCLPSFPTCE